MKEERVSRTEDEKELDRRNFLKCMAWVGTGAVWTLSGGILNGSPLGQSAGGPLLSHDAGALRFVQISDSSLPRNHGLTVCRSVDWTSNR